MTTGSPLRPAKGSTAASGYPRHEHVPVRIETHGDVEIHHCSCNAVRVRITYCNTVLPWHSCSGCTHGWGRRPEDL